jgi:hypothetical protein
MYNLKFEDKEHQKIQNEILSQSKELKLIEKSYAFGAATVLKSIFEWCGELDKRNIKSLTAKEIREAFKDWSKSYDEIEEILYKLK